MLRFKVGFNFWIYCTSGLSLGCVGLCIEIENLGGIGAVFMVCMECYEVHIFGCVGDGFWGLAE